MTTVNNDQKTQAIVASCLKAGDTIITPYNEYDVDKIDVGYGRFGCVKVVSGYSVSYFQECDIVTIRAKNEGADDDFCLDW